MPWSNSCIIVAISDYSYDGGESNKDSDLNDVPCPCFPLPSRELVLGNWRPRLYLPLFSQVPSAPHSCHTYLAVVILGLVSWHEDYVYLFPQANAPSFVDMGWGIG